VEPLRSPRVRLAVNVSVPRGRVKDAEPGPRSAVPDRPLIGTAGRALPREALQEFPAEGTHLTRYAGTLPAVEINSSFHRPHRRAHTSGGPTAYPRVPLLRQGAGGDHARRAPRRHRGAAGRLPGRGRLHRRVGDHLPARRLLEPRTPPAPELAPRGRVLLREQRTERENPSFEAVNLLLAQEVGFARGYFGGEYLFNREPDDLARGTV
jgi:hypothetical protein